MPDIEMLDDLQVDMPKFNQDILDGLAYSGLRTAKQDVDQLIRCAEKSYPAGFEYLGSKICSPIEAYNVMASSMTRSNRSSPSIDFAPSDVILVKYLFACEGRELSPRYFYLPYVRRGGLMTIAGKQFCINSVAVDPCFSVGEDHVFIRMSRAPVTFRRVFHTVIVDGNESLSKYIAHSLLHHRGGSNNKKSESDTIVLGRVLTTLPHYLFCRYGMEETFRRFAGATVRLTTQDELLANPVDKDKFVVITSSHNRPSTLKTKIDYRLIRSPIAIVLPRDRWTDLTKAFCAAFFYIVDHYPEVTNQEELLGSWRWKVWLGYVLWGDQLGTPKLVENVESHLKSLDDYVDIEVRRMLMEEENLDIENIYELFAYVLVEMDDMISNKQLDIGSMFGKRLVTTPYVLRDIYEQIFRCLFEITNNRKRTHTAEDYNKILGKYFMTTTIFNLRKTSLKAFISSVSTPGDNMFMKITSRLVMQSQTSAGRKGGNINVNDPMSHLHYSIAEAGNHLILPKHSPLGRNTINPTVLMDEKNTIIPKEHMREVLAHIDEAIHRNH